MLESPDQTGDSAAMIGATVQIHQPRAHRDFAHVFGARDCRWGPLSQHAMMNAMNNR